MGHIRMSDQEKESKELIERIEADLSQPAVNWKAPAIKQLTDRVDATDVVHQTENYKLILHTEIASVIEQLHHRADMMRRRAGEFDTMADRLEEACASHISQSETISLTYQEVEKLLAEHAHIKPSRV